MPGFLLGVAVGFAAALGLVGFLVVNRSWRHATFAAAPIPWGGILGMKLRGTPPELIADAYVSLTKRGRAVDWSIVEATYLAHRRANMTSPELARLVEVNQNEELESTS